MTIVNAKDARAATFAALKPLTRPRGNRGTNDKTTYADCITAYDIETTNIPAIRQSIMWVWQWYFGSPIDITYVGRTWDELADFIQFLDDYIPKDLTLVVWVHNLGFEYHFLRNVWEWEPENVFAVKSRKPLKATHGRLEYRCSYLQSNMGLRTLLKTYQVEHQKLEMNYKEQRYPWSEISLADLRYAVNDVIGLVEAITARMATTHDTLYTVPLTSTGYVRRDVKSAMRAYRRGYVESIAPDYDTYLQLHRAFRGGNTHANRYVVNDIIDDVNCYDFSSSYPARQTEELFPVSAFRLDPGEYEDDTVIYDYIHQRKAVLCDVAITGLRLRDPRWPCPYISKSKCVNLITDHDCDNGRVMQADYLELTVTDIDWEIIKSEYDYDNVYVHNLRYARYGRLPKPIIDLVNGYFSRKTALKGVREGKIMYNLLKALLNAIYGMSAQDPCKERTLYNPTVDCAVEDIWEIEHRTTEDQVDQLAKYNRSAVEPYQWGVWTTAHARRELEAAIRLCYEQGTFVYCDTDSVYFTGNVNIDEYNRKMVKKAKKSGSYATDPEGNTHYMGVMEHDGHYKQMRTMGAKKYVCVCDDGSLKVTIAGVNKQEGAKELQELGGIDAFEAGLTFRRAGGTNSVYNDAVYGDYTVDGHTIHIGPNIYIEDSTYTLGQTAEYCRLLGVPYTG